MSQEYDLQANIQKVLTVMHTDGNGGEDTNTFTDEEEKETIHVYPVEGGGILLTRTPIAEDENLDTAPLSPQPAHQSASNAATGVLLFGLFVILSCLMCIMVQFYLIINPFTVTITLAARSQQLSLRGTLQLGRVLNPITISQSQTAPATGHGHQSAQQARGYITFYNGQLQSVFVPAGTTLTGTSGEQIQTDADANIPAGNPPMYGQISVSAHALVSGVKGNIPAYDINESCCAIAILAKNTTAFRGGADERDFQTVAQSDTTETAAPLKITVHQSVQGALQGQVKPNEGIVTSSCTSATTADHRIGDEAAAVTVTVSETCSAVAYNQDTLQAKVTDLLKSQAVKKFGSGYSILGYPQITVTATAKQNTRVLLSFTAQSTWIYALSSAEQAHIKKLIAGIAKEKALQLLAALPGIERVSLKSSGFGDDTRIPKQTEYIHILVMYAVS